MWTAGTTPTDPDATWPTPLVAKIVTSFSQPGAQVALLPWPQTPHHPHLTVVGETGGTDHTPTDRGTDLTAALTAVESLGRAGRFVHVLANPSTTGPGSRPFWADLIGDPDHPPMAAAPPSGRGSTVLDDPGALPQDSVTSMDLIITSLRPADGGDRFSDLMALVAARLLRVGGILAVLTHCDWTSGELTDPTGAVVAAAQNADLLYLQHIVALHVPVRGGRVATELLTDADSSAAEGQARAEHRAAVRGLPAPHRRIHTDVLVFAQPQEYEPLPVSPAVQAVETGVIR